MFTHFSVAVLGNLDMISNKGEGRVQAELLVGFEHQTSNSYSKDITMGWTLETLAT